MAKMFEDYEPEIFVLLKELPLGYKISNHGRVLSPNRSYIKSDGRRQSIKSRFLKINVNAGGYQVVYIRDEYGKKKCFRVHRLVALAFVENPNNLPILNHKNGNKLVNYFKNLEWCDHSYNLQHAYDNNLRTYNVKPAIEARRKKY